MKTIKNCVGQQLICGLAIIFVLCGTWTRLQANETSTWIDIRLHPEQGVYSFSISGLKFNLNFMPLKEEELVEKEPVKISFKQEVIDQNEFQHDITDKSVLGVVLGSDKERSELLFVKGWTIRLKNLQTIEAYIWSEENVALKKGNETPPYELPAKKEFTIEIHANEIEAELRLPLNSFPQNNNPIKLIQKRALAESLIEYRLRQDAVKEGKCRISILFFFENAEENIKVISMDVEPKKNEQGLWGTAVLPIPEDFWSKWRRLSKPVRAVAIVTNEDGTFAVKIDNIFVTRKKLSIIGGVLVVVLFLIIVRLVKRIPFSKKWDKDRYKKWDKLERGEKFFRFPLHFAVTPLGRYSISLAQILFWTVIVIFAFVYVAISRGEFLSITEQMLILLGISGSTSIVSKAAAVARLREIPEEHMEKITKDRIPHFRDLFCIGDVPNIFKFQIFAFTLLAGSLVIRELLRSGNFPTLEQNLLTLMGISGGVYIANELATKNVWEKLQKLIDEHDKKKKEKDELSGLERKKTEFENELEKLRDLLATRKTIPPDDLDKKREHELQDRIAKYKEKLANKEEVEKKEKSLKNEIRELLKKIYTESEETKVQDQQKEESS